MYVKRSAENGSDVWTFYERPDKSLNIGESEEEAKLYLASRGLKLQKVTLDDTNPSTCDQKDFYDVLKL